MGLFEKFRKNNNHNNNPQQWNMENMPYAGEQTMSETVAPNERQQAKIIAALNGNINALGQRETEIGTDERANFYEKLATGKITVSDEKKVLSNIAGPKHQYGSMAVYTGLAVDRTGHQKAIRGVFDREYMMKLTAVFSGRGYEKYQEVEAGDIARFWDKFATPADFEPESEKFLEMIKQNNTPAKYQQYQRHMREFKHTMFGKQQEYWEQMQLLEKEAKERQHRGQTMRLMGETAVHIGELEPVVKAVGLAEASKAQVSQGIGEQLIDDGTSQDTSLLMPEQGIFGVFDGVGGEVGGRLASSIAAREVERMSKEKKVQGLTDLSNMLNTASDVINSTDGAGASTGTLVQIAETGGDKLLMWASVGDSRVYIVDRQNQARQISKDEGYENKITNALGGGFLGERVQQAGTVLLNEGDRVVLCSDGITGDKGADLMSDQELGTIVGRAQTAEIAANDLVRTARKRDDRTVVVVQV